MSGVEEKIIVGKVTGVFGIKGWVKVYSYTEPRESITDYARWYLRYAGHSNNQWTEIKVEQGRKQAKTIAVKLEGFDDRNEAMQLTGAEIGIDADQLEPLNSDEFYWRDLIGLRVINQQAVELGTVTGLLETGANDVLVVKDDAAGLERLIPWTHGHVVIDVDLVLGVITVDWLAEWDSD